MGGPWTCNTCHEVLPVEEFYKCEKGKQSYRCKPCARALRKQRWADNTSGDRDKGIAYYNSRRPELVEQYRWNALSRKYGISREQYEAMLAEQGGVCAICRKPEVKLASPGGRRTRAESNAEPVVQKLAVDHDHRCCPGEKSCGKCVRKLLCVSCNGVVGKIEVHDLLPAINTYLSYADTRV